MGKHHQECISFRAVSTVCIYLSTQKYGHSSYSTSCMDYVLIHITNLFHSQVHGTVQRPFHGHLNLRHKESVVPSRDYTAPHLSPSCFRNQLDSQSRKVTNNQQVFLTNTIENVYISRRKNKRSQKHKHFNCLFQLSIRGKQSHIQTHQQSVGLRVVIIGITVKGSTQTTRSVPICPRNGHLDVVLTIPVDLKLETCLQRLRDTILITGLIEMPRVEQLYHPQQAGNDNRVKEQIQNKLSQEGQPKIYRVLQSFRNSRESHTKFLTAAYPLQESI